MILVIGSAGLLGNAVMKAAGEEGVAVYHSQKPDFSNTIPADITKQEDIDRLMELEPKIVINCAAMANPDACSENRELAKEINATAVSLLSKACDKVDAKFIHISTDFVFDGSRGLYKETDDPKPVNFYGETKLLGERSLLPNDICVRTSLVGWSHGKRQNIADWVVNSLRKGEEVNAFANSYFTPIYVSKLAKILIEMGKRNFQGLYHVGGTERLSKYEFALEAADVFGLDKSLVKKGDITKWGRLVKRPLDTSMDCTKVQQSGIALPTVRESLEQMKKEETQKASQDQ